MRKGFVVTIESKKRIESIDVTERIAKEVENKGFKNGLLFLFLPHTTAAITINENYDENVGKDINDALSKIAPSNSNYKHLEGNADSHIKSAIIGNAVIVPIIENKLFLGTWQGIMLFEFDGPRKRKIYAFFVENDF